MSDRRWRLREILASTPWWAVSVVFHIAVLLILWRINFRVTLRPKVQQEIAIRHEISEHIVQPPAPVPVIWKETPVADVEPSPVETQQDVGDENQPEEQTKMAGDEGLDQGIEDLGGEFVAMLAPDGFGPTDGTGPGPRVGLFVGRRPGKPRVRPEDTITIKPVQIGLQWLARHQSDDGSWKANGWTNQCPAGHSCVGHGGGKVNDAGKADATAITGLVLLAFLGNGQTHMVGDFRKTVKDGLDYLRKVQDSRGRFRPGNMYTHGIAALAAVEAYGMTRDRRYKIVAQKAVDYICEVQNPLGGWDYTSPSKRNDMSVAGWQIMALKSAYVCKLKMPEDTMKRVVRWLDIATNEETGAVAYAINGNDPEANFPGGGGSIRMRAAGMLCHLFFGADRKAPMMVKSGDAFLKRLPVWQGAENNGKVPGVDLYYWYYASLVSFQLPKKHWDTWNVAMKKALLGGQVTDERSHAFGSWPPVDVYSDHWSRPGATALSVLCLEVYYRYPKHWMEQR